MVALLVRLKLTLLKHSLKRSAWRTVGLVIGMLYALAAVVVSVVGLVALRLTAPTLAADVTVVAFSMLTAGWLMFSLLVFGVDETVDPSKFALLPVRARQLLPGLLVAGLVGSPGIATVLVSLGLVVTWTRSVPLTLAALVAVPLGVATCFLMSRAGTAAFASFLASRRFRDFAFVVLALFGAGIGVGGNLLGGLARSGRAHLLEALNAAAGMAAWTPFGWAWAIPADVAYGRWLSGSAHLVLAVGLVAALWRTWEYFLAKRLVEPTNGGGQGSTVRTSTFVERLFPATPAGGVASRTLRYWRRDPRYLAGVAGFLIAPVILMVSQFVSAHGSRAVAAFAPALLSVLLGMSVAQDLSYDGTAVWQHVASGLSGRDDRLGRVLSTATVFGPLLVVLLGVAVGVSGEWRLLPMVAGLTFGLALTGLGVGSLVGVLWQWPAPPPGANPFQKGNSGGLPPLLSFSVTSMATMILSLPVIGLAFGSIWLPWLGWLALPVGVVLGGVVLLVGVNQGGRLLDRRWPEVLAAVGEKAA